MADCPDLSGETMPGKTVSLKFTRTINAPPAEAFRAFTHPTALRDWLCQSAQTDARAGGRLYLWWDDGYRANGVFTAFDPGQKLAFTWDGLNEPGPMKVEASFAAKDGGTLVTVKHGGIGGGKKWADTRRAFERAWPESLENLQSVLETGIDLRLARRPRMGIFIDEFNPEIAARIGAPVKAGIRLAGTAEGTGAHAAGLQRDDVIVKVGGKPAVDFPSLGRALERHQGGDKVPVVFYRGAEKKTVIMELSRRPIPETPATPAELAALARKNHAAVLEDLAKRLEGATEAEAERKPAPHEWNLKELVAHFIATERDLQSWAAQMLNDRECGDDLEFRPNVTLRLDAIIARYPTLAALQDELKRASEETAAMLAALPPEFVAHRKHLYQRVAGWIRDVTPSHLPDEHGAQVQATLEAARQK
jgi:uncharacterized protein YndB with AHSA1/START domain